VYFAYASMRPGLDPTFRDGAVRIDPFVRLIEIRGMDERASGGMIGYDQ
jgi:hypothetical protein